MAAPPGTTERSKQPQAAQNKRFKECQQLMCGVGLTALLIGSFLGVSCTSSGYSFVRYGQAADPATRRFNPAQDPQLSDILALNYADSVATLLRAKYTGARITREVSSSAQIILAAVAGAGAGGAFHLSKDALTVLGLGSAGIPELQRIFGAKERAQLYQDTVRLIEEAEIEYLAYNQRPTTELTQNGVTLFQRVTASIHVVEKTLAGNLPSVIDLKKATEPMTADGAVPTAAGTEVFNLTPASGDPAMGKSDLAELRGQRHSEVVVMRPPTAPKASAPVIRADRTLLERNKALRDAYENLTGDTLAKALADNGAADKEALGLALLSASDNLPLITAAADPEHPSDAPRVRSAAFSVSTYCDRAEGDATLTARLEKGCRTLRLPGFRKG